MKLGTKTDVTKWSNLVDQGKVFELSAVADGAYALPAYHDMIMTANSGTDASMIFEGFFINASQNPVLVEFWEGGSWTGGDSGVTPTAINRDRNSTNTSVANVSIKAHYVTPIVHATQGVLLTQLTIYSGSTAFDFANMANLSETWNLKPNTDYTVRLRNSSASACSISARMVWAEVAN